MRARERQDGALCGHDQILEAVASRGYTAAARFLVAFASGNTAFVKLATTPLTADALRLEASVYGAMSAPFMPEYHGFEDHASEPPLVLEDLRAAHWPLPWNVAAQCGAGSARDGSPHADDHHSGPLDLDFEAPAVGVVPLFVRFLGAAVGAYYEQIRPFVAMDSRR